jgi:hypothetical protein
MASCNTCKVEYWLDFKTGHKMDKDDHSKLHVCTGVVATEQKDGARNYYEEKEKKIEQLAEKKIAAINRVADALYFFAKAFLPIIMHKGNRSSNN